MFKTIRVSEASYNWLQKEKKRTNLSIKTIVDGALVHLAALGNKKKANKLIGGND